MALRQKGLDIFSDVAGTLLPPVDDGPAWTIPRSELGFGNGLLHLHQMGW